MHIERARHMGRGPGSVCLATIVMALLFGVPAGAMKATRSKKADHRIQQTQHQGYRAVVFHAETMEALMPVQVRSARAWNFPRERKIKMHAPSWRLSYLGFAGRILTLVGTVKPGEIERLQQAQSQLGIFDMLGRAEIPVCVMAKWGRKKNEQKKYLFDVGLGEVFSATGRNKVIKPAIQLLRERMPGEYGGLGSLRAYYTSPDIKGDRSDVKPPWWGGVHPIRLTDGLFPGLHH